MSTPTPKSRTAFIAWLLSFDAVDDYELQSYIAFNSDTGLYMEPQVQRAWAAWQAAENQPALTTCASSETVTTKLDIPNEIAPPSATQQTEELAMLVRRLAARLKLRSKTGPHATPDNAMVDQALDYLQRHGLQGSILREPRLEQSASTDGEGA